MINIGLYYKVREGCVDEFERLFNNAVSVIMESGMGCTDARLYREVKDPMEYMLYTEWEDEKSFEAFLKSDAYKKTVEAGKGIVEGHPKHRIFTEA